MNIIINADDFGISESVNQAIVDLYKKEVLSSTTLLVDTPYAKAAADLAKRDKIPVGLHFNLTLHNEFFTGRGDFERKLLKGKVKLSYVRAELERQYQKMLDFGLTPTHLDSHQHIHSWPQIFPILALFARKKKIPLRLVLEMPIYNKYEPLTIDCWKHVLRKFTAMIFGHWNWLVAKILGVRTNSALTSVFALCPAPSQLEEKHLRHILHCAGDNDNIEYMCHPALAPDAPTSITAISVQEYALMTNREFFAMIHNKFNLISFKDLGGN